MFSVLSELPVIGVAVRFVRDKGRLVVEYAMIATVITLCGVALTLWLQKGEIEKKLEVNVVKVNSLETALEAQDQTIGELKGLRSRDAEALTGLLRDFQSLSKNDSAVRDRLFKLEQTNEIVRQYLDTPIPLELQCLLNDTCAPAGDKVREGNPAGRAASGVR